MPALFYYSHSNMTLQSYGIIPEKQEKSSTEDELFYGMCQKSNCVNLTLGKGDAPCVGHRPREIWMNRLSRQKVG